MAKSLSLKIVKNFPLKKITTMKVGGPAKLFLITKSEKDLIDAISWAKEKKIKWHVIGGGSNLVPRDRGFDGLIIKNEIKGIKKSGNKVVVGSGENLTKFILKIDKLGLAGMEKMAGIPGTVGGAVYGCAGAYGQEIKDSIIRVKALKNGKAKWFSKKQCQFTYRQSFFKKKKDWIILSAEFKFAKSNSALLQKASRDIMAMRNKKYPLTLACPGSFFKNVVIKKISPAALRKKFLSKIPKEEKLFGKVTARYLLESVGAKGMKKGKIRVADYHGNLIYNSGNGKTKDVERLISALKTKVFKKYGIKLEEEIQYL